MGEFDGKVVLVTGGGTGLGAAVAIGAARRGARAAILNYSRSATLPSNSPMYPPRVSDPPGLTPLHPPSIWSRSG